MNQSQNQNEIDFTDPLLRQLSAMQPACPAGFESRLAFAAGQAEAARQYSSRASRRTWVNAAAMLLVAVGGFAISWNCAFYTQLALGLARNTSSNQSTAVVPRSETPEVATTEKPVTVTALNDPGDLTENNLRPTSHPSLNQLLDDMLRNHLPAPTFETGLGDKVGFDYSNVRISSSPPGKKTAKPLDAGGKRVWQDAIGLHADNTNFVAIAPSAQTRRVISELTSGMTLPEDLPDLSRTMREIDWITFSFKVEGNLPMHLTIQATREINPKELATGIGRLAAWIGAVPTDQDLPVYMLRELTTSRPVIDGSRITWSAAGSDIPDVKQDMEKLLGQQESVNARNSVRQIVLAMHNYESASEKFPDCAFGEGESKGLSWRVAILPFVDHMELHKQFHLDEPWDSEHNRTLIPRMPRMFLHASSGLAPSDGRSSFIVPTGAGLIFEAGVERKFKDISDGTSNTVLILVVDDEHGEVWTKPVEKNFDLQKPRAGLMLSPRGEYLFGRVDGFVDFRRNTLSDDALRALMTIAGGEEIQIDR